MLGSLNYIINKLIEGYSFEEALNFAMNEGFTEPDPKLYLNGAGAEVIASGIFGDIISISSK